MHPWKAIGLKEYEKHMSLQSVYQLQTMDTIMAQQLGDTPRESVMILGVAGGNGLSHVRPELHKKIYGVDINEAYLAACRRRYASLRDALKTICTDVTEDVSCLPQTELLIANLFVEYVGYDCFRHILEQTQPQAVSCAIQINEEDSFVSESPYLHVFDRLEEVHHQIEESALTKTLEAAGYHKTLGRSWPLPNGKQLLQLDFKR